MKLSRRLILRGAAGVTLGLPILESIGGFNKSARAQDNTPGADPYAIFFRQANGVSQAQRDISIPGQQDQFIYPERFWPEGMGSLNLDMLRGPNDDEPRAVSELSNHINELLVIRDVTLTDYYELYGDGHANGAVQSLTGRGPFEDTSGGNSSANGESLDHRIGRELNPEGLESLFLYAGPVENGLTHGWLGGACISWRGPDTKREPIVTPFSAFESFAGRENVAPEVFQSIQTRQRSLNDYVREQMQALLSSSRLSSSDRNRLELHRSNIRDLEVALTCNFNEPGDEAAVRAANAHLIESDNGDTIFQHVRLYMDIAALAVACGRTRSVALQVGTGNDSFGRYREFDANAQPTGRLMENFHFISHRRPSDGFDGEIIDNADVLHYQIDRQFGRAFSYLLDKLKTYDDPTHGNLLNAGMAVWYNDLSNGPAHSFVGVPYIIAGSAGGQLRQGEVISADPRIQANPSFRDSPDYNEISNHTQLLNTIGAAVGLRNEQGQPLDDFGDTSESGGPRGRIDRMLVGSAQD